MNGPIGRTFVPLGSGAALPLKPALVRQKVIGLVLVNDLENPLQDRIGHDQLVSEDDFNLRQPALFGQHDHPAQLLKFIRIGDHLLGIQLVDRAAKDPLDEPVDMADPLIDHQRHPPAPLEPAAEHHIMLALIGAVLGNFCLESMIVGAAHPHGL